MATNNAIGIDIGGTNLRVALVSEKGKILNRIRVPSQGNILTNVTSLVDRLINDKTAGIGIAIAGIIDKGKGSVVISPNLPSAEDLNLADIIGRKYSLPTYMLNDANAAALGEKSAGKGKDLESFILLTLGTGIGGGIIFRHELMDVPAEIGHMTIVPEGRECDCGNHGCLEEYAAAKALINMATSAIENGTKSSLGLCCEGNIYKITPELIYKHAMNGDMLARDILKTAGKYLGIAIANLANIFYPSAFILAGGLSNAWNIYVEEAIREADKRAMPGLFDKDTVFRSEIYEDAGLIGVALYSLFT